MAIDRTTENQVIATERKDQQWLTRWVIRIGFPVVIIASLLWTDFIWIWVLLFIVSIRLIRFTVSPIVLSGAAGEERTLKSLMELPKEYTLFNQIRLPDKRSTTGFREADFVIVGPNGVFIVENKDYKGEIRGDECSANWELHKTGIGGTPYSKTCRNPIRQVRVYVALLGSLFRERGIKAKITPMVSLSRDNNMDGISCEKVRVVRVMDLCENILAHHGTLTMENMDKVLALLEELRSGQIIQDEETVNLVEPYMETLNTKTYDQD